MVVQTDLAEVVLAADKKDKKDEKVPPLKHPGWDLVPIEEDRTNMEAMWGLVLPDAAYSDQGVGNYRTKWEMREVNDSRRCSKCRERYGNHKLPRHDAKGPIQVCFFHPGTIRNPLDANARWTCCGKNVFGKGCQSEGKHADYTQFVLDPRFNSLLQDREIFPTPELVHEARSAVVLKCETGVSNTGDNELIRVTAIDYYSGEILIDSLVWPDQPMLHYNPRFSGIQPKDMSDQFKERRTLRGREGARKALWKFIGLQTYVIMHQGHMDMGHLRWYHGRMVDTWELQKRMSGGRQPLEFKRLVKHLLGRQLPAYRGYASTLQEVMATRDLLRWHVKNLPQNLWTKPRVFTSAECHWHMNYDVLPGDTQIEVWWQILLAMRIFDD
ncbi:hypothetical protein N7493_002351 [Penicillium malachiteum]|uniref:Exonuclease domain-containing protein n=1 Tax=Penicillium malachiteum TaxID=1324776 RepID=A0AAD6HS22_9EURO|nr:hypothetical protein N7493_002351 [Penicillium malachiteum]